MVMLAMSWSGLLAGCRIVFNLMVNSGSLMLILNEQKEQLEKATKALAEFEAKEKEAIAKARKADILEVRLPVKRGGERQSKIIGDRRDVVNKYVKIPVVIQAIQWTGENHRNIYDFLTGTTGEAMSSSGDNFYIDHDKVSAGLVIKTLEGDILARVDDYIVKGVRGEFYPIKPDIFEILYNPVATD